MKIAKLILKYILIYIIMIVCFFSCFYVVTKIPRESIEKNVKEACKTLDRTGIMKNLLNYVVLDDFTDAVMLDVTYSLETTEPLDSILRIRKSYDKNRTFKEKQWNTVAYEDLKNSINKENTEYTTYGRYWHGYCVYLKPLLVVLNYKTIEILFTIILYLLGIIFVYLIYKKIDKVIAIIITIALFIVGYQYAGLSLTYFPVLAISIITSILIILKKNIKIEYMFIVGGLTSFFDLLTTPILTLGLPLLTYLIVCKEKCTYKKMFLIMLNWVLGYGIIWASKWVISDGIIHTNIIQDALSTIQTKSGSYVDGKKITIFKTVIENCEWILYESIFLILITIISIICNIKEKIKISKKEIFKYIIIAIIPIIWYALVKNHSYSHSKFTYRNLLLTIISLGIIDYNIIKNSIEKVKRRKEEIK